MTVAWSREEVVKSDQAFDLLQRELKRFWWTACVLKLYLLRFYFSPCLYFFIVYPKEKKIYLNRFKFTLFISLIWGFEMLTNLLCSEKYASRS